MKIKFVANIALISFIVFGIANAQASVLQLAGEGDCLIQKPAGSFSYSRVLFVKSYDEKATKISYLKDQIRVGDSYLISIPNGYTNVLFQTAIGPDGGYTMNCYNLSIHSGDMKVVFNNPQEKVCHCTIS